MKRKWFIPVIAAVAALGILVGIFWETVFIYAAPKAALTKALTNTVSQLQTRFADSPLALIGQSVDLQGNNTIDLQLDTNNKLLGDIQVNMIVQTESAPRKIAANGRISSNGGTLDLSVYLDPEFAAISSESLLDGSYYGITYETFPEDIRSFPLLPLLIGKTTLAKWEKNVSELQNWMGTQNNIPAYSASDLRLALGGILTLKPKVSKDALRLDGESREVHQLDFQASGAELASFAQGYTQNLSTGLLNIVEKFQNDPESTVNISFFLYEDVIVKVSMYLKAAEDNLRGELYFGSNPALDPMNLALIHQSGDDLNKWSVDIQTMYDSARYAETISTQHIENGVQDRRIYDYTRDLATGDIQLMGSEEDIFLNLQLTDAGLRMETDQFEDLMRLFGREEKEGESACRMLVSKGAEVSTPEYKNLDLWSADDLLTLLGGLGSMLGLEME